MSVWTIGDIIDIVREGVPFSDPNSITIRTENSSIFKVTVSMTVPLEKIRDISITSGPDITQFLFQSFHPELNQNGNFASIDVYSSWCVYNNTVQTSVNLILNAYEIGQTARKIRDSSFYSVFEAAISN